VVVDCSTATTVASGRRARPGAEAAQVLGMARWSARISAGLQPLAGSESGEFDAAPAQLRA
jgi:hypothetical protein